MTDEASREMVAKIVGAEFVPNKPTSVSDNLLERVIRDLAKKLYAHHVIKYDPAAEERCIQEAVEASNDLAGEMVEKHVQRCRDAIAECPNWSPAQAEWSRARDALLNLQDELATLSRMRGARNGGGGQ